MIDVVVSNVSPTYGASRRTASISNTSTDPAATKTIAAAHGAGNGAMAACASCLGDFARARDVFVLMLDQTPRGGLRFPITQTAPIANIADPPSAVKARLLQ